MGIFSISNASNISQAESLKDRSNWTAVTQFTQPGWRIALWAITYSFIVITSIIGNITIIWIILAHRRMRTATNYFIVNLALSDLLMSAFNTIFNFIYASHNVWYFGEEFCRFQNWFPITAMFVSIYSMTAVAAERYVAIIHPFKPRLSAGSTRVIIGMIWLVAFGLAFPQCFYAEIMTDNGTTKCIVVWPDDVGSKHQYHIAVIVLIYLLPLMVMFVAYSIIGITLWSSAVPGNHLNSVRYEHQLNAKKKFVKTMVVVVIIFAVCWLPYHIYFILGSFKEDIYQQKYIQQVYLAVFLLAMSSTMYNPIIYCCLNQRQFCSLFCQSAFNVKHPNTSASSLRKQAASSFNFSCFLKKLPVGKHTYFPQMLCFSQMLLPAQSAPSTEHVKHPAISLILYIYLKYKEV
uniref:Substance-K receptor n=1 Tax=Falco tinnunculus TaxID=100819 RepID=A0A8C4UHK1_FALTI